MKSVVIFSALPAATGLKRSFENMPITNPIVTTARTLVNIAKTKPAANVNVELDAEFAVGHGCCNGDSCPGVIFSYKSTLSMFIVNFINFSEF